MEDKNNEHCFSGVASLVLPKGLGDEAVLRCVETDYRNRC